MTPHDLRLAATEEWSRGRRRHARRILTLAATVRRWSQPRAAGSSDLSLRRDDEQQIRTAQARLVSAIKAKAGNEPRAALRNAGHSLDEWLRIAHRTADVIDRTPVLLGRGPIYRVEAAVRDLLGEGNALLAVVTEPASDRGRTDQRATTTSNATTPSTPS
jgi:hypothetical protein